LKGRRDKVSGLRRKKEQGRKSREKLSHFLFGIDRK